jgi:hypothetical protein
VLTVNANVAAQRNAKTLCISSLPSSIAQCFGTVSVEPDPTDGRQSTRYVVTTRLKPGATRAAEKLLAQGPPFDPAEAGLSAHAVYLTDDRVFLVFEGEAARAKALALARRHVVEVSKWQELVWELPSVVEDVPADARCFYRWPEPPPALRP